MSQGRAGIVLGKKAYIHGLHLFLLDIRQMSRYMRMYVPLFLSPSFSMRQFGPFLFFSRYTFVGVTPQPASQGTLNNMSLGEIGYAVGGICVEESVASRTDFVRVSSLGRQGMSVRSFNESDLVGLLLDMDSRRLDYFVNGEHIACVSADLMDAPLYVALGNHIEGKATCIAACFDAEDLAHEYAEMRV